IRKALQDIAARDPDESVRAAAYAALGSLGDRAGLRSIPDRRGNPFWFGFCGWYVFNGLAAWLAIIWSSNSSTSSAATVIGVLLLLVNLAALISAALRPNRRGLAAGMLAAWAVAFLVVLALGVLVAVSCFLPRRA